MYEGLGFSREGLRPRQAKARSGNGGETRYFDELLMGLFVEGEVTPTQDASGKKQRE